MKKIVVLFTLMLSVIMTMVCMPAEAKANPSGPVSIEEAGIGDIVCFGNYNDNTEWIVLDRRDGNLLLLSKNTIMKRNYYEDQYTAVTWEESAIRSWLNESYYETAFTAEERNRILYSNILNADTRSTDAGNDTEDYIFLLSIDEVNAYFPSRESKVAILNEGNTVDSGRAVSWWLRSPGGFANTPALVSEDGSVNYSGSLAEFFNSVRPAMWVKASDDPAADTLDKEQYRNAQTGNIVRFGYYDGHSEWIVVDIQENRMLLLSRYLLVPVAYYPEFTEVTWETSTLRKWLNETYFNYAFSAEEQEMILTTYVPNPANEENGTDGGRETEDRIFIFSSQELLSYFPDAEDRVAKAADGTAFHYWLRTPGSNNKRAIYVDNVGLPGYSGDSVNTCENFIRPALWIDLS